MTCTPPVGGARRGGLIQLNARGAHEFTLCGREEPHQCSNLRDSSLMWFVAREDGRPLREDLHASAQDQRFAMLADTFGPHTDLPAPVSPVSPVSEREAAVAKVSISGGMPPFADPH